MRWMDVLENIPDVKRSSGALDRGSLTEKYQPVFRPLTKYSSSTAHQQENVRTADAGESESKHVALEKHSRLQRIFLETKEREN
ncbi:uncharacterized protein [Chiloscyllium punctatum]|uniref:uncharacterized protein isoform X3 n=1 Tax=Chiloscyllium punctatum TaxID=137246 RepID=UPI003B63B483